MKATKLVHSCLLVESNGQRILADPGVYSWQSGVVTDKHLAKLDAVVVTHAHPDHLNPDFAEAIHQKSPEAHWYCPPELTAKLSELGIESSNTSEDTQIKFVESKHADLSPWFGEQPEHASYVLFGEILIGGDCHTLSQSHGARILAGAINGGPWGGVVGFAKMVEAMEQRPQVVLPLHDWHWNESARKAIYDRLPEVLQQFDVGFVPLQDGVSVEV